MRYGQFRPETREYEILRPDTPASWVNYLGTEEYCAIVSNNAAGYGFHRSPKTGRMLRFRFNSVPTDRPGRYFYLRDASDGDVWSVTWQPVAKPFRVPGEPVDPSKVDYRCAHRPGITRFSASYRDVDAELTAFVPIGESAEVWSLTLENNGKTPRTLGLFGYVEWCFWHIMQDAMNFQYILYTCRMGEVDGIIDYSLRLWPLEEPAGYFLSTAPVTSFDTDREVFLGNYRHEGIPVALENGKCAGSIAVGGTPCGALHSDVTLAPGEKKTITFALGVGSAKTKGREMRARFSDPKEIEKAVKAIDAYWDERLAGITMKTPDAAIDAMGNTWNQVQCHTTFKWSRSASFNEAGGRDGIGYRDTCQDTLGVVHAVPDQVKGKLVTLLEAQHSFGAAMHHVQPLTFTPGKHNVQPPHFSDDHLWLPLALAAYLRETNDAAFLDQSVPYADEGAGTVLEHMLRALDFSWENRGPHGLCLGLAADWNDCLNLRGQGESTFSTFLYVKAMRETVGFLRQYPDAAGSRARLADGIEARQREVLGAIDAHAYDGDWFLRGYVDSGKKLGASESIGSKIFLNAQSWAVLANVASSERLTRAMDSVHEHLATEHGAVLNAPAYLDHDAEIGAITTFPPGLKENGGIFCHANTWPVIAEALLGRGDEAYRLFRAFLPAAKNDGAELYTMEPYAYSQFITGKDHPYHFGRARNSWLTGTATWAFVALTQYILGVRADYDALVVKPAIPRDWPGFSITRKYRGATYDITVEGSGSVASATMDGVPVAIVEGAARLAVAPAGARVRVVVRLADAKPAAAE